MKAEHNNEEIKVSISCCTYNHEKYIFKALEGFVTQKTNFKFEVIVHDDASTDGTREIVQTFAEKYPDIIYPIYQTENQYSKGVKIFRTYILPKMRGKYLAICEGDDYWCDAYKLQKQVDFLDNHSEYSACVHNSLFWDLYKNELKLFNESVVEYDLQTSHVLLRGGTDYHTSAVMYRMQYAREIHSENCPDFYNKPKNIGDYPLSIFLTLRGKVRYLPDIMSVYRFGTPGSWTKRMENKKLFIETEYSLIDMLVSVDDYTNYRFHERIQEVIDKRYLKILNLAIGLNVLKSKEMLRVFRTQKLIRKIKIIIKLLCFNKIRYY